MQQATERYIDGDAISVRRRETGSHVVTYGERMWAVDVFLSVGDLVRLRNEIDRHLRELDESSEDDSSRLAEAATGYESIRRSE